MGFAGGVSMGGAAGVMHRDAPVPDNGPMSRAANIAAAGLPDPKGGSAAAFPPAARPGCP